jgi:type IV secretory pathway VirB10-like protein
MSQISEPTRLLEDPTVASTLQSDLASATAASPVVYQVEAGLVRFQASMGASGAVPATSAATVAASSASGGAKLWLAAGGLAVAGGLALVLFGGGEQPQPPALQPAVAVAEVDEAKQAAPPAEEVPKVEEAVAPAASPEPVPAVEPEPEVELPAAKPASKKTRAVEESATSAFLREAKKVQQAKKALTSDPAKTLRLLRAVDREFPKGQLMEERAGLRVLALFGTGRADEGKRKAEAYLGRYPKGTLASRVRRALSEAP